jgi:ribosomal protein S18 acetylase RimI-like enzyme
LCLRPALGLPAGATGEPSGPRNPRRRATARGARGLTDVVVREASIGDAPAIADLHVRSWRSAYRGIVPDAILDGLSVDARRDVWTRAIGRAATEPSNEARVWVVEEAGAVRGFAETRPSRDDDAQPGTGEVHSIYLAPEAWGRGLGQRLLAHASDDLRARGFVPLVLWVIEDNAPGRRFYERAGWRPDGARQPIDFDGVMVDEIRYRLD